MPRNELIFASQKTHEILVKSLSIQVHCFGKPGFIGALKRLFRKIDFASSSRSLRGYIANLDYCLKELKEMRNESLHEKEYALLLVNYIDSLKTMIHKMDIVIKALAFRATGGKVPYREYGDLVAELDAAQFVCSQIGLELDAKYRELVKNS